MGCACYYCARALSSEIARYKSRAATEKNLVQHYSRNQPPGRGKMSSDAYDKVQYSHQGRYGLELLDRLSIPEGGRVLDLGCGTGYLASVLAERVGPGGRVTGVDPSRERILLAESKYVQHNNLQFMDKSSEDFPAGPYDIVFCNFVLHWIQDKQTVFRRVHENLKSGGVFAFLCPAKPASSIWEQLNPEIDHVHHFGTTGRIHQIG